MSEGITLKQKFEKKKKNSLSRGIDFNLSEEEYKTLWQLRNNVNCAYTNRPFKHGKVGSDYYPTLERIDNNKPYEVGNVVWCSLIANQLKGKHIEQNKPAVDLSTEHTNIVNRLKKMTNNSSAMDRVLAPYKEAFANLNKTLEEDAKWDLEVRFAEYYVNLAKEFQEAGVTMNISLGTLKKIVLRCHKDQISREPFTNLDSKKLWVVDKTKKITQDNVKVVHLVTRVALDKLSMVGDLKIIAKGLSKCN